MTHLKLQKLRKKIDSSDILLFDAIFKRLEVVKEISALKKELNLDAVDSDRLLDITLSYRKLAFDNGYNPDLGEDVISAIHKHSSKIVNDIINS